MGRREEIKRRFKWIKGLFVALIFVIISFSILRETHMFVSSVSFFESELLDYKKSEIALEISNRQDEIASIMATIEDEFKSDLLEKVQLINYFALENVQAMPENSTLEEKRSVYVNTILQYDLSEEDYLYFAIDLNGETWLMGLTASTTHNDLSGLQDPITGDFIVLDMIDIITSSPTNDGYITYNWPKEIDGEPMEKTSYLYYNEDVDLFIGAGLYIDDYKDQVIVELVTRMEDYYEYTSNHFFIISNDGDIFTHSHEEYTKEDILLLEDVDGNLLHNQIVNGLKQADSIWINFYEVDENGKSMENLTYVEAIDGWDMYIGQAMELNVLEILYDEYEGGAFRSLAITIIIQFVMISSFIYFIGSKMNSNFVDVEKEFADQTTQIRKASMRDSLTNLYNRKYFDIALRKLKIDNVNDYYVIMGDANGLKLTNDAYGHDYGDLLLVTISKLLQESFETSYIFRWGGDEFLVLAPLNEKEVIKSIDTFFEKAKETDTGKVSVSISFGYSSCEYEEDPYLCVNSAEKMMYQNKTLESASTKRKIIDNILESLYGSYNFEKLHSNNVCEYALLIGEELQLNQVEINRLRLGALMHDIGKISISDTIMTKPSALTDDEYDEVKQHSEKGFRILSAYPELSEYGYIVLHHHERFDGTGYPKQLAGEDIPLYSRIITIADAFDAMTGDRTYREAFTKEEAIKELIRCKGSHFDPELVDMFIKQMKEKV